MPILLTVDPRSGVPMYLQLIEQVKRSVALGILGSGEQLPTVKQLALDLTINPNTVARAYRDLERDGVIETSPGRGSFIRANGEAAPTHAAANDVVSDALDTVVRDAKSMGLDRSALRTVVDRVINRWFPEER
jgi:GntR family transcriptional regulator